MPLLSKLRNSCLDQKERSPQVNRYNLIEQFAAGAFNVVACFVRSVVNKGIEAIEVFDRFSNDATTAGWVGQITDDVSSGSTSGLNAGNDLLRGRLFYPVHNH